MLKYKKIINLTFGALFCATLGTTYSCDDFVEEIPISQVSPESFYSNNSEIESALIATYSGLASAYAQYYINWGEFRSDNLFPIGQNIVRASMHDSTFDSGEASILRWNRVYQVIDRANRVINQGLNVDGVDFSLIGEAYAIRAKVYFDMIRVWGAVPLFTESIASLDDAFKSRTSAQEILSQVIIPDMVKAEELIANPSSNYRFSQSSVLALQSEVYAWINENESAKASILKLIGLNTHSLVQTPEAWEELFINQEANFNLPDAPGKVQSGPELIFSINYEEGVGPSSGVSRAYMAGSKASVISPIVESEWIRKFPLDTTWNDLYPDTPPVFTQEVLDDDGNTVEEPLYGDWRLFASRESGSFEEGFGSVVRGEARVSKWQKDPLGLNPNLDNTDLVIYRFADIVLLLAEVELKLGNVQAALDIVNDLRMARQLPTVSITDFGATFDSQLDYILHERQMELIGEGKRWWDLVRNNKTLEVMNPVLDFRQVEQDLTEERLLWPILDEHLDENDKLNQNSGW